MKKQTKLPLGRRILFSFIPIIGFFLLLEALLRLGGIDKTDMLINLSAGFSGRETHFTFLKDDHGSPVVKTKSMPRALFGRELLNPAAFSQKRDPGVFRIILLGGSTTYGWPLDDRFSYASWLRAGLPESADGRRFEILNFGVPGYGSRRILNLVRESLRFDPDMMILLTGHNEILESEFSESVIKMPEPLVAAHARLVEHSRLYGLLNFLAVRIRRTFSPADQPLRPTLPRVYRPQRSLLVEEAFRRNLRRILHLCREESVPLVLCTVPANILDMPPNGDFPPSSWETAPPDIPSLLEQRPRDALLHYRYGRYLYEAGEYEKAGEHLQKACDYDPIALRVTSRLNRAIRETASGGGGSLVDLREVFQEKAPRRIPGNDLFSDNCHPNIESHQMIAFALACFLARRSWIAVLPGWEEDFQDKVRQASDNQPLNDRDLYHYWQYMASFYSLHGAEEQYRESRERMRVLEEKLRRRI